MVLDNKRYWKPKGQSKIDNPEKLGWELPTYSLTRNLLSGLTNANFFLPISACSCSLISVHSEIKYRIIRRKVKQWWSTIPLIYTKKKNRTTTSHLKSLNQMPLHNIWGWANPSLIFILTAMLRSTHVYYQLVHLHRFSLARLISGILPIHDMNSCIFRNHIVSCVLWVCCLSCCNIWGWKSRSCWKTGTTMWLG
jgi:hypothetical protein